MPTGSSNYNNNGGNGSSSGSIHANGVGMQYEGAGADPLPFAGEYTRSAQESGFVGSRFSGLQSNRQGRRVFAISATDLTFLWSGCQRCTYNKIVLGIQQPKGAFPAIFTQIDRAMKSYLDGTRTEAVGEDTGLPPGRIMTAKKPVRSRDIVLPDHPEVAITLFGQPDAIIRLDEIAENGDGAASAICDYKTSHVAAAKQKMYSRQLHAYAIAAEQPAGGYQAGRLEQVSRLGLLAFEPKRFKSRDNSRKAKDITGFFAGELHWVEVRRDDEEFFEFLSEVVAVLKRPSAPEAASGCTYCQYVERMLRCKQ